MTEKKNPSHASPAASADPAADPRPAYEPPRVVKKKAVTRATLFSGGGGPTSLPALVPTG
jgi:hypothetical protein